MAEHAENVLAVIQSAEENKENEDSSFEPEPKKLRTDDSSSALVHKLEDRLTGILCCAVCLDLPGTCFQVIHFQIFYTARFLISLSILFHYALVRDKHRIANTLL